MAGHEVERRLAAILAADVVGYSRLMEHDETGTLAALKERRRSVLDPLVARHRGRIFKFTGDGVLVEFGSAVSAVRCAVELQAGMAEANRDAPAGRQIALRIGINLGDVILEGSDLYGEGVNIAARLEGIAEPGSILVSGTAFDHCRNKVQAGFEDMGPRSLKNMEEPVRIYRVAGTPQAAVATRHARPDKPSLAVLPFLNLSGDPEQQYFSDGMTEDIITELSRFRSLFVIARNSSFQYRANDIDVRRVGAELGVQYVVEGSIRRAGERLRITAQLIDAGSGDHVWAERYDRDIEDVFAVQDEVARTIAATLEGRVAASAVEKVKRKPTSDMRAYDYFLQGRERDARYDMVGAESFYARAIELDPGYAHAHAFRAITLTVMDWSNEKRRWTQLAIASAQRALSLDPNDGWCNEAAGYVAMREGKFELAGVHLERAVSLNPNDSLIAADHANWLVRTGRPEEALKRLDAAMRRDPYPATWIWEMRFLALFHLRRYQEAIAALNSISNIPSWLDVYFAAVYAHAGRPHDARLAVARLVRALPFMSIREITATEPYADRALLDHLLDGLRQARLPE